MKLEVTNMTCGHCKMTIEKALNEKGFKNVEADLATKLVSFELNGNTEEVARQAIEAKGYEIK